MNKRDIKKRLLELEKQKQNVKEEMEKLSLVISDCQKKLNKIDKETLQLSSFLIESEPTEPRISDHALLRYLERKYNLNIEKIKSEILTENVITAINSGACSVQKDGLQFKIANKIITTVIK